MFSKSTPTYAPLRLEFQRHLRCDHSSSELWLSSVVNFSLLDRVANVNVNPLSIIGHRTAFSNIPHGDSIHVLSPSQPCRAKEGPLCFLHARSNKNQDSFLLTPPSLHLRCLRHLPSRPHLLLPPLPGHPALQESGLTIEPTPMRAPAVARLRSRFAGTG